MLIEEDQNTELHLSRSKTIEVKTILLNSPIAADVFMGCGVVMCLMYLCGLVNPSTSDELKLCEEMSKIIVNNVTAKFTGKHTRFVYNSDVEFARELESSSKIEEKEERLV
ncbi:hypothetical protein Tco_0206701 [Tanacetum coccineum]